MTSWRERARAAASSIAPAQALTHAALATAILLPVVAVASYGHLYLGFSRPGDSTLFEPAGRALLTGRWDEVFADSIVQAGPLELWIFGVLALVGLGGTVAWTLFYTATTSALVFVLAVATIAVLPPMRDAHRVYLAAGAAGAATLAFFVPWAMLVGHPAQVAVPVLWLLAGVAARREHFASVGILIGLAAGFELWGILGAAVVLLAPRPRVVRSAVAGVLTLAVLYGPFAATGTFEMFHHEWPVLSTTLWGRWWPGMETFPWGLRVAEAAVVLGVGAAVAVAGRRWPHGVWLAPLALSVTRIALDPVTFSYYWIAPGVLLCVGGALALARREWLLFALSAVLTVWLTSNTVPGLLQARTTDGALVLWVIVVLALPAAIEFARRRRHPAQEA